VVDSKRDPDLVDAELDERRARRSTSLMPVSTHTEQISRVDPLRSYMDEVRRYRILSREEEMEVADRFKATGDPKAAYLLVTSNLRLVVKIALEYRHAHKNVLDLIQEGNVGLMMSLQKFDPDKGNRFGTYAQWWIRAYILKYLMDNFTLVKMGTTQAQRKLFYNLKKEKARLEQLGIEPSSHALAASLDVRERDIREMETRMRGGTEVSLNAPLSFEEDLGTLMDVIRDGEAGPDRKVEQEEIQTMLGRKMAEFEQTLTQRDLLIWKHRLVAEQPLTLQELGDQFQISRERARQLEARLLLRFKEFLRREIPDLQDLDLAALDG
jgi:RNA polymerase sigma-32 factor